MKLVKWFGVASLAVTITAFSAQAQERCCQTNAT